MAETIYTKKCPQCGGWYRVEENTSTGEFFAACDRCGKLDDVTFVKGEDGVHAIREVHEKGYGCISLERRNNSNTEYLIAPVTEEMKEAFMAALEDPDVDKEKSYFTIWDEEKQDVVAFYGKIPPVFVEPRKQNIYMTALFSILRRQAPGVYVPVTKDQLTYLSVGGFAFTVDNHEVMFDWDASAISEIEPGVFKYESGYGPFFNSHAISDSCAEAIEAQGLRMEQITAAFLANADKITEFHITLDDLQTEDMSFGLIEDNADDDAEYRVLLKEVTLQDDTLPSRTDPYMIELAVLDSYNKGEK